MKLNKEDERPDLREENMAKLNKCRCGAIAKWTRWGSAINCDGLGCSRRVEGDTQKEIAKMWNLANPKKRAK